MNTLRMKLRPQSAQQSRCRSLFGPNIEQRVTRENALNEAATPKCRPLNEAATPIYDFADLRFRFTISI